MSENRLAEWYRIRYHYPWWGARMASCDKLLEAAQNNLAGLRFAEICQLAECHGFVLTRTKGSHRIYTREGFPRPLSFQNRNGRAKAYQVKQLLDAIDEISTEEGPE
ncbi:MAG: type II toxin-antitoxin system HicA family toxin [Longimicrobiaceae bacterium]